MFTLRIYAAALVLAIAGICGMALVYLFGAVFTPAKLPAEFAEWQGRLEATALRQPHVPGVTGEARRAPMAHFHKVNNWFQMDDRNGCTVSGCHSPLPHDQKSKIAAFANLHVTFMECNVCHEPATGPTPVNWISTRSGDTIEPPAVLRLIKLLEATVDTRDDANRSHGQIVALLKETIANNGQTKILDDLLVQIDSSPPFSPLWRKSVKRLAEELPQHARGEYNAKLTRATSAIDMKKVLSETPAMLAAGEGQREAKSKSLHTNVLEKPAACATCHAAEPGMIDFAAAGYSPRRTRALRELPLARLIQQIRQGEQFNLPKLLEAPNEK